MHDMPTDPAPRLLMLDDDHELATMTGEFLGLEGFVLRLAHTPDAAVAALEAETPDLLILDVMLPQRSGFEVLRRLRQTHPRLPVLMLTARGDAIDRVLGLELGADDYLTKPFDPRELAARVRAILRRARPEADNGSQPEPPSLVIGSLHIDAQRRRIHAGTGAAELTGAELRVLQRLARNAGQVVTRAALTEDALGRKLTPYDRSIDTHVSNLRRKLTDCGAADVEIRALRGAGYELVAIGGTTP
jgi:two-component system, OmpR family, response regulator CpxR